MIWSAPLLIIICLGAVTWMGTHLLDPYRLLGRIASDRPVASGRAPLEVEVVALDWKWLFIYPEYGVATVNELAAPVDRPIDFQHHRLLGDELLLHPGAGRPDLRHARHGDPAACGDQQAGAYEGFSANYSGAGFSGMRFAFQGLTADGF